MSNAFTHTDRDGDTLLVQQGLQSAVFTATDSDSGATAQVAVHPDDLARLIDTLQAMLPELG